MAAVSKNGLGGKGGVRWKDGIQDLKSGITSGRIFDIKNVGTTS